MTHTLRGLGELIAYLPYELGFVPTDSLVAIGLSRGSVDVVARLDLAPQDQFLTTVDRAVAAFVRSQIQDVICCVMPDRAVPADQVGAWLDQARSRFGRGGLPVRHLLVATDTMWWAHRCGCRACPTEPTAVPRPEQVAAVFASVLDGVAPVSSRAALAAGLRRRRAEIIARVEAAFVEDAALSDEALAASLWEILHGATAIDQIPPQRLAAVSASLVEPIRRDDVFGWVTPGMPRLPGPVAEPTALQRAWTTLESRSASRGAPAISAAASRARMTAWLQCLPDPLRPPVLTFIAGSAWSGGAGALAAVAIEQAQVIDPQYRLAHLLARVLECGLRPGRAPELIETPAAHC